MSTMSSYVPRNPCVLALNALRSGIPPSHKRSPPVPMPRPRAIVAACRGPRTQPSACVDETCLSAYADVYENGDGDCVMCGEPGSGCGPCGRGGAADVDRAAGAPAGRYARALGWSWQEIGQRLGVTKADRASQARQAFWGR